MSRSQERPFSDFAADKARYRTKTAWLTQPALYAIATYRFGRWTLAQNKLVSLLAHPIYFLAYSVVRLLVGIDIPRSVSIGPGLLIHHFGGIIINPLAKIGSNFEIRQGVTIGTLKSESDVPQIGNGVTVGAYAQVLGAIDVGSGSTIGALASLIEVFHQTPLSLASRRARCEGPEMPRSHRDGELSVVIPAFNSAATISRAIDSAKAVHAYVIVVDDGSSDSTAAVADARADLVIRQVNGGASRARRRGLASVRTDFCIFLDSDDELVAEGVLASVASISSGFEFVIGATALRGRDHRISPWPEGVDLLTALARGTSIGPPSAILWRTQFIARVLEDEPDGIWPRYAEDYELLVRGCLHADPGTHNEVTSRYTVVGGKSTVNPLASLRCAEEIRRHYARIAGISIHERSQRSLESLVLVRRIFDDGLTHRNFRWWTIMTKATCRDPRSPRG